MATLNFSLGNRRVGFDKKLLSSITRIIDDEMLDLAIELQRTSPVATGKLKESWDVIPSQVQAGGSIVSGRVTNDASNSLFRVRGRAAGKQPPTSAIAAWLTAIGGDPKLAFVIARSIGRKGTRRFRSKENNAGINPDGTLKPNSPIAKADKAINRRLRSIKI